MDIGEINKNDTLKTILGKIFKIKGDFEMDIEGDYTAVTDPYENLDRWDIDFKVVMKDKTLLLKEVPKWE